MMIDLVDWAQYINVTDTQTHRQPRRHSKCYANAPRRAAKTKVENSRSESVRKDEMTKVEEMEVTVFWMINRRHR